VLLEIRLALSPQDHQSHRHFEFEVAPDCQALNIVVHYQPKFLESDLSLPLARRSVARRAQQWSAAVGPSLAARWLSDLGTPDGRMQIPNLLTVSLDDAEGSYRGAAHRQADTQHLRIGACAASPGLVAGPLPAGPWRLTLTAHTIVTPSCDVLIQIGAETATSSSSASSSSA
jgi:hypothetical protein